MDVGRRHKTHGSETKDSVTYFVTQKPSRAARASAYLSQLLLTLSHSGRWISPVGTCTRRRWYYKSLLFGDQNLLDSKHACPPLWKKTLSYKAVFCVSSLRKNKGLLFVKMCRKVRNPWRIALPQLWPTHSLLSSLRNGKMWQRTYPFISPYFPSVYFFYPVLSLTLLCKSVNHEALIILV